MIEEEPEEVVEEPEVEEEEACSGFSCAAETLVDSEGGLSTNVEGTTEEEEATFEEEEPIIEEAPTVDIEEVE